jgi:pectate lyase
MMTQNVIRVPQGCPTVEKAMALALIFSERKEYTTGDSLKIRLEEGVHEIVGDQWGQMNVTCSHITFVGKGKDRTTIRGGFHVDNKQNVRFEELTITNPRPAGCGLSLQGSETNVDVLKCVVKECANAGMYVYDGATVTATQCEFMENHGSGVVCGGANTKARLNDCTMHHNGYHGLVARHHPVVDVHGTKTDIHSNKMYGIRAYNRGKINIHLPSQHNTSHDNVGEDRYQEDGGSIANINADGTFTHVVPQ